MRVAHSVPGKPVQERVAKAGLNRPLVHQARQVGQEECIRSYARQRRPPKVMQRRRRQEQRAGDNEAMRGSDEEDSEEARPRGAHQG